MALAVIEHHSSPLSKFSTYDICEILAELWKLTETRAHAGEIKVDFPSIKILHQQLCTAFDLEEGEFLEREIWEELVQYFDGDFADNPTTILNIMFATLYWQNLTQLRLITAWFYTSAIRIHKGEDVLFLDFVAIGEFLEALSGGGPPIFDGQTFYLEDYCQEI